MARRDYYKVKVRIYELSMERKKELKIFNEGYVIIKDDMFEGYLTLDYIYGILDSNIKRLLIHIQDYNNSENFSFSSEVDEFTLPETYLLYSDVYYDNKTCYLEFEKKEKLPEEQKKIENILRETKKIHKIPN